MADDVATTTSTPNPHAIWVEAVKSMEPEAWDDLLKYYAEELRRDIEISLRKRGLPSDLVEDIEQETWLTAIRKIREFSWESDEKFYHWLRTISLNHVRTYRRIQQRGLSVDDFSGSLTDNGGPEEFFETRLLSESSLEEEIILKEQFLALDQAMRELKPEAQGILMRWLLGETPRQLALAFNIKPRSVSTFLLRAKEKIQANIRLLHKKGDYDD